MRKAIITVIISITILFVPVMAFATKCNPETKEGCERRVKRQHEEINAYVSKHKKRGYTEDEINTQAKKACSTEYSKRCRPQED